MWIRKKIKRWAKGHGNIWTMVSRNKEMTSGNKSVKTTRQERELRRFGSPQNNLGLGPGIVIAWTFATKIQKFRH